MADVKINKRYTCGDALKVSNGDNDAPTEYLSITHDATDASEEIGYGSKVVEFSCGFIYAAWSDGRRGNADVYFHKLQVGEEAEYVVQ